MADYNKARKETRKAKNLVEDVPEPAIWKGSYPIKAMLVEESIIVLGNDRGEIKVIDKYNNFAECGTLACLDDPIISIGK